MDFVADILIKTGIAKPKTSIYSGFQQSVVNLDKQVTDTSKKLEGFNKCCDHLKADEQDEAVKIAIKTFGLTSLEAAHKKMQAAKEKGDAAAMAKALPKKTLFTGLTKGVSKVLDDLPDLVSKTAKLVEEGAEMVTQRLPNSGAGGLELFVTGVKAKAVAAKASTLKEKMDTMKGQADTLKGKLEEMKAEADSLPDDEAAE